LNKVVFTNGCFDILHRGHIELLRYCKKHGLKVIVGLNSDKSIKRLKGDSRPINNQNDRKFLLESLRYVDEVIIFNEDTPYNIIKKIKPDIIVKGGDYKEKDIIGSDISKVKIFKYVEGYSTTKKIKDIVNRR
jgi:D-beta-D-heptose 7-phosphate kinase / D-beta-D-heptose 1-phosphate adenosyltransferase